MNSEDQWRAMADHAPALLWVTDPAGTATEFNQTWLQWRGRTVDQELGDGWLEGLHTEDLGAWTQLLDAATSGHEHVRAVLRIRGANDEHLPVSVAGHPWFTSTGELGGFVFAGQMSGQSAPLDALTGGSDLFQSTIEALQEGVVVISVEGRFLFANTAAEGFLGIDRDGWRGQHLKDLIADLDVIDEHGTPVPADQRPSFVTLRTGQPVSARLLAWHIRGNGLRWFSVNSRPLLNIGGHATAVATSFLDVTAQKHEADNARHEARHDALTGLVNRWGLRDMARSVLERKPRQGTDVALLYCDLDDFKRVNDSLGHAGGDELLQLLAARIRQAVRASDVVARLGGDEVVVILDEVNGLPGALVTAEKIRAAVARPATVRGVVVTPRVSIGVAILDAFTNFDEALNRADEAMYVAKEAGRDRVVTLD